MNMIITNQQEAEKFVLSYLETHEEFFRVYEEFFKKVVLPKFALQKVRRNRKLKTVDLTPEEEENLQISLQDMHNGNTTRIGDTKIWLDNLVKDNV